MKSKLPAPRERSVHKPVSKMTPAELTEFTKQFDRPTVTTRPLSKTLRAELERVRRPVGRPKVGDGAERVLVTIERGLLRQADAYCEANQLKRAELVAIGLRKAMTA